MLIVKFYQCEEKYCVFQLLWKFLSLFYYCPLCSSKLICDSLWCSWIFYCNVEVFVSVINQEVLCETVVVNLCHNYFCCCFIFFCVNNIQLYYNHLLTCLFFPKIPKSVKLLFGERNICCLGEKKNVGQNFDILWKIFMKFHTQV